MDMPILKQLSCNVVTIYLTKEQPLDTLLQSKSIVENARIKIYISDIA